MKILIVDDEPLARSRLAALVEEIGGHQVVGQAANGVEAIQVSQQELADVVLLDVRMPGMDGLEAAQHLQRCSEPPAIIFTTAYDDHALAAFEAHAVDYLLKPVRRQRLEEALNNAKRRTRAQVAAINEEKSGPRTHICARVRDNLVLISIDDIYYFMADHKYITVRHKNGETLIEESLKALSDEFNSGFTRIHRNALVADTKIAGLSKNNEARQSIRFIEIDDSLEVSRRHLPAVRKKLRDARLI